MTQKLLITKALPFIGGELQTETITMKADMSLKEIDAAISDLQKDAPVGTSISVSLLDTDTGWALVDKVIVKKHDAEEGNINPPENADATPQSDAAAPTNGNDGAAAGGGYTDDMRGRG